MESNFGELLQYQEIVDDVLIEGGFGVADRLFNAIPAVQRRKAESVLRLVIDRLGEGEFHQNLMKEPRVFRLIAETMHAAALTDTQAKLAALGTVAVRGLEDSAQYDEARHIIRVIGELDVIHVRVLVALDDGIRDPERDRDLDIAQVLGISQGTAEAICGDLIRSALAEPGGMSFRGLHGRLARVSPLGIEVLEVLRAAGTDPTTVDLP